jgi:hypothetical protein
MTIDELIESVCPFKRKIAKLCFAVGFRYATTWWFLREKIRHQEDIDHIESDLLKCGKAGVDVSKLSEYIDL